MLTRMKLLLMLVWACSLALAGPMRAGFAKTDVTPHEPVMMGGYDLRDAPSDGVHGQDKLYVRCLAFDDGTRKVLFVEGDVIMIRDQDEFRQRISKATGIPVSDILVGDAHNHAAPSPGPKGETNWERQFDMAMVETARQALANLQPVLLATGEGRSRIATNRRQVRTRDADTLLSFDENARSHLISVANEFICHCTNAIRTDT